MSLDHFAVELDETDRYVVESWLVCRVCSERVLSADSATLPALVIAADAHACQDTADPTVALARELAAARAEIARLRGDAVSSPQRDRLTVPALRVVDDDEGHQAFKRPGPRFGCRCSYVFDTAAELKDHQTRCGVAARHKNLDGHAEPGGLKWGET